MKRQNMSNTRALRKLLAIRETFFTGNPMIDTLDRDVRRNFASINHLYRHGAESGNPKLIVAAEQLKESVSEIINRADKGTFAEDAVIERGREALQEVESWIEIQSLTENSHRHETA